MKNSSLKSKVDLQNVYTKEFNVYALINKAKKLLHWPKEREIPEEVIRNIYNSYIKNKHHIRNKWAWFLIALQKECGQYSAQKSIQEAQNLNAMTQDKNLQDLISKITKVMSGNERNKEKEIPGV